MSETLPIGLSSWIIQDGNYSDFKVGQKCSFALEFYAPEPLKLLSTAHAVVPTHTYEGDARFTVIGKTVYVEPEWWVLDFGYPAYVSSRRVPPQPISSTLEGSIYLGVDPFDYFERLSRRPNAPPLIFDWQVQRIEIQTAPFVQRGDRLRVRDPERIGWRQIGETEAWKDDNGSAEYILHCTRLNTKPRNTLSP